MPRIFIGVVALLRGLGDGSHGVQGRSPDSRSRRPRPPETEAVQTLFTDFDCRNDQNSKL